MYSRSLAFPAGRGGAIESPGPGRGDLEEWQPEPEEGASLLTIPSLLAILLRWKWLFLGVVTACLVVAALWAATQTPLYRATATLELNSSTARVVETENSQEATQPDRDFLALQIGLMKSRNLAERVSRALNLGRDEAFLGGPPQRNSSEAATSELMDNFSAAGTTSDRIVQISYVHPDAGVAAKVVNAFADQAVESTFERALESTARSRAFLQRQLETTRQELERSERELIAYARQANIVNIVSDEASSGDSAGGTLVASNLVALNQQLADAQNARITAQQRYAQAQASANAATATDGTVQLLQQQRAQLQAEYDQKLERYLPDHPEMIALRARLAGLQTQISGATGRSASAVVGSLRADAIAAQNRESQLQGKIKQLESQLLDLNDRGVRYTILRRAVEANRSLYNALLAKLGEENTAGTRTSNIAVIDTARPPRAPFEPNVPRTMILALLAGLVLGTGACIGADRWSDTINSPEDIRMQLGLPILGVVPKLPKGEAIDDQLRNPRSVVSEAYHSIRATLQFSGNARRVPASLLVTSSRATEGKTTTVIALAADFISVGLRVVVIDADLRNPSIKGNSRDGGLTARLTGRKTLHEEIAATDTPGLYLIDAGLVAPNPTVLLANPSFAQLIATLEKEFDVVLVDGPPVLGLADAPLIASCVRATVLVVESGSTRRRPAATAVNRLTTAGATIVGAVLTKYDRKVQGYGYGEEGYEYEYGSESKKRVLIGPGPVVEAV